MTVNSRLNVILGAGNVHDTTFTYKRFFLLTYLQLGDRKIDKTVRYDTPNEVNAYLNAFYNRGYRQIDTARLYSTGAPGTSEPRLGAVGAGERFTIDTKVLSQEPGSHKRDKIA